MFRWIKKLFKGSKPVETRDEANVESSYKQNNGYCVICDREVTFIEYGPWLRDSYICNTCHSLPRNRALIHVLNTFIPDWRSKTIHESSPDGVASDHIKQQCDNYSESQLFDNIEYGQYKNDIRCENLECMTFDDKSFDIFITQDVFEHVMAPDKAFSEIARVLRSGSVHVFTPPWYPKNKKTVQRVQINNGEIVHLLEPVYHDNPVSGDGSLVTYNWGLDLVDYIYQNSGMTTMIYLLNDRNLGLDAEFLHVFISFKLK